MLPNDASQRPAHPELDTSATSRNPYWRGNLCRIALLLAVWASVTIIPVYWARDWQGQLFGWPAAYWMAGFGAPLAYLCIIAVYAWRSNSAEARHERER